MSDSENLVVDGAIRYGWMRARPRVANPLEGAAGPIGWLRRTRLKEWIGLFVAHSEWSAGFILQDAKYHRASDVHAYHGDTDTLVTHSTRGEVSLPANALETTSSVSGPGYDIRLVFGGPGGTHRITIDVAASTEGPAMRGELLLHGEGSSAPLSVSERLTRGSLYTWKETFPVSGELRVGDSTIRFEPARDVAIIDEHRSLQPYRTDWTWGTFGFPTASGIVGANFVTRPHRAGQQGESALWADGVCEPLGDITFVPSGQDPLAPWTITSDDGGLAVEFTPKRRKPTVLSLGVFAMDYVMMYGSYRGIVRTDRATYGVHDVPGTCERMHARL
ncbi:DUF2804 family protein [Microbacterium gorillae]|uniref:DUF2804 family protein n=1 Tax=Microbacterium gorillae TaxID=1231063 RepID=UPI0006945A4C|nr:DUF2804 family protein [Microbacterium gorillae]